MSRAVRYSRMRSSRQRMAMRARLTTARPGFTGSRLATAGSHDPGFAGRPEYHGDGRNRRAYGSPYAWGVPYVLPGWGYLPGDFYADDDDAASPGEQPAVAASAPAQPLMAAEAPGPMQAQLQAPAQSPTQAQVLAPAAPRLTAPAAKPSVHIPTLPQDDGAVTLVFKDGRAPMQIHNYMLTRTTLYLQGLGHREIALDQLDLEATLKANREAGIEFNLPEAPE